MFGLIKGAGKLAVAPAVGASRVAYGAAKGGVAAATSQALGPAGLAVASESMRFLKGDKSGSSGTSKAADEIVNSRKIEVTENSILGSIDKSLKGIGSILQSIDKSTRLNGMVLYKMLNVWRDQRGDSYERARAKLKPMTNPFARVAPSDEKDDKKKDKGPGFFGRIGLGLKNFGMGALNWFKEGGWKKVLLGAAGIGLVALIGADFKKFVEDKLGTKFSEMTPMEIFDAAKEYIKSKLVGPESTLGKAIAKFTGFLDLFKSGEGEDKEWDMSKIMLGMSALTLFLTPFLGLTAAKAALFGLAITGFIKLYDFVKSGLESLGLGEDTAATVAGVTTATAAGVTAFGANKIRKSISASLAGETKASKNAMDMNKLAKSSSPIDKKPGLVSRSLTNVAKMTKPVVGLAASGLAQTAAATKNMGVAAVQKTADSIKLLSKQFPRLGKLFGFLKKIPKGGPLAALLAGPEIVMALTNDDLSNKEKAQAIAGPLGGIVGSIAALGATMTAAFPGPGWLASLVLGGAGYFGGSYIAKKLAGWALGDEQKPDDMVGPEGYPIDQPMIRKKNQRGQPTSEMIPNPDYIPPPGDATLNVGAVSTPGAAISGVDGAGIAATTIINNYYGGTTNQINNSDQSTQGGGRPQATGSSGYGKLRMTPFANALVG